MAFLARRALEVSLDVLEPKARIVLSALEVGQELSSQLNGDAFMLGGITKELEGSQRFPVDSLRLENRSYLAGQDLDLCRTPFFQIDQRQLQRDQGTVIGHPPRGKSLSCTGENAYRFGPPPKPCHNSPLQPAQPKEIQVVPVVAREIP